MTMDYALIDAAVRADVVQVLRQRAVTHAPRSLFENQPEAAHANAGPWLLALDGEPGLRDWLHGMEQLPGAVARLGSDASFEVVFRHLEGCLDMQLADGSLAMFRFWDGRVFWRTWQVLVPAQRRALLGPINKWTVQLQGRERSVDLATLENA